MRTDVAEGQMDIDLQIRAALVADVRECGLSRWEIAGRMGRALSAEVSKWQIDSWSAESKEKNRFPLAYASAWCWATGSNRVLDLVAHSLGLRMVTDVDVERAEIQRAREELKLRQKELRARERKLGGTK